MKIKLRGLVSAGAIILCVGSAITVAAAQDKLATVVATVASNISLTLNGSAWHPQDAKGNPVYPLTVDGTSYLPVRALSQALGVDISWDGATQTIVIGKAPANSDASAVSDSAAPTPAPAAPSSAPKEDLTKLPIGDDKYTLDGPKKGYIYVKRVPQGGGGASKDGDWIDKADGTFDITKKAVVDGKVDWHSELDVELKGDQRIITGNRLPDHPTGKYPIDPSDDAYEYDHNPNAIKEQLFQVALPANPVAASEPSPVNQGAIGVMLSGALLFDGLDEMGRDAVAHETQDGCYGHPEKNGTYHYHNLSACIDDPYTGEHSKLIGYALDGFGIYGKYGDGGKLLTDDDLDEFHGHMGWIDWDGKKVYMYHYHVTDEYPYTIGAFKGTPAELVMTGQDKSGSQGPGSQSGPQGPGSQKPGSQTPHSSPPPR